MICVHSRDWLTSGGFSSTHHEYIRTAHASTARSAIVFGKVHGRHTVSIHVMHLLVKQPASPRLTDHMYVWSISHHCCRCDCKHETVAHARKDWSSLEFDSTRQHILKMRCAFLIAQEMGCSHHIEWLPNLCRAMIDSNTCRNSPKWDCTECVQTAPYDCACAQSIAPCDHKKHAVVHPGCTWTMVTCASLPQCGLLRNRTSDAWIAQI